MRQQKTDMLCRIFIIYLELFACDLEVLVPLDAACADLDTSTTDRLGKRSPLEIRIFALVS